MQYGLARLLRLNTVWRALAIVLLAALAIQFFASVHPPSERNAGTALSAGTLDVAVVTARKAIAETTDARPVMATASAGAPRPAPAIDRLRDSERVRSLAEARAPPPRGHPARLPDSTAPPLT